jgi:hypothetical protein
MRENDNGLLNEIRDLLKVLTDEQRNIIEEIRVLKAEQKKIQEDIKLNNFVLNNINFRNEIVN